jgi:glutamate racemase
MSNESAIGVFDSGLGGLSAVRELAKLLPNENIIYFGDTGRVPYGSKSRETIRKYTVQDASFLLSHGVKAILAACGTVSSNALECIEELTDIPVFGVVEDAARVAYEASKTKRIGIIGTQATVNSGIFKKKIEAIDEKAVVLQCACPLFVPLVEYGFAAEGDEITRLACERYLAGFRGEVDTLVLGCTHFPILEKAIAAALPGVTLVNPAGEAARAVAKALSACDMLSARSEKGEIRYFVSDEPTRFNTEGKIFLGKDFSINAEKIEIDKY